jgi:hypothetical protein
MTFTFKRGRKIGDPNYSSTEIGLEITAECDEELYYDRPADFEKWAATQYAAADGLLEAEISRIYAARPKPVETASQRDEHRAEPATSRASYQNGDGAQAIEDARQRAEPAAGYHGNGNGNGYTKQPIDFGRNPAPPSGGQYRSGGGGKSYGPPKTGSQLVAWAKGIEESGDAKGLSKWIMYQWGRAHGLGDAKVVTWPEEAVRDCYDEARTRQESGH